MSFSVVMEGDHFRVTFTEVLTHDDLVGLITVSDELELGRDVVPSRLADMRGISEVRVAYPDIQEFADERKARRFPNSFKTAILVGSSVQLGMARMFRTVNDNPQITIEIFEDELEALRWLQE